MLRSLAFALLLLVPQNVVTRNVNSGTVSALPIQVAQFCQAVDPISSCTMSSNVGAFDTLIFFSFNNNNFAGVDTPLSDTRCGNATFWHVIANAQPEQFMGVGFWWCQPSTGGPDTINITPASNSHFLVLDVVGTAATSPIDVGSAWAATSVVATVTSPSITTTVTGDLLVGVEAYEFGNSSISANNSFVWTGAGAGVAAGTFRPWNAFSVKATAPGSYNVTFTNNNAAQSRGFAAAIVAIKPH